MSRHIQSYITVELVNLKTKPAVLIQGREFTSERKQYEGNDVYLEMSLSEALWLLSELQQAVGVVGDG